MLIPVIAKIEPSTDEFILKHSPGSKKFDVQIYRMDGRPFARFMWYQRKPRKNQKTVMLNCYKWQLIWR